MAGAAAFAIRPKTRDPSQLAMFEALARAKLARWPAVLDRLLALPGFLRNGDSPAATDIAAAFRLTGYFLARHVYEPRDMEMPDARARLIALVERAGELPLTAIESPPAAG